MEFKKDRVVLGDNFLRRDTFKSIMQRIKEQKMKNIVIIGGSHSGFSCAWMLLKGPATFQHNSAIKCSFNSFPGA